MLVRKRAFQIILSQSTSYNRHITGKIYAVGITGPIGTTFSIGSLHHEIGISGVYEIGEQEYPIGEVVIDAIPSGYVRVEYIREEEE